MRLLSLGREIHRGGDAAVADAAGNARPAAGDFERVTRRACIQVDGDELGFLVVPVRAS
ncbi:MAG: hypothetical protein OEN01_14560 [Candidatus Krumholzibacteria bacterium]|nr:hypothetical protein [Candidatus Krumholzibacteria bacterium]